MPKKTAREGPFSTGIRTSGSPGALLHRSPLRTVRASFPAYGSSLYEVPEGTGVVTDRH
jgi:hypothetical protein